ncbi:MAG: glycosyltransferase [Crocinitomix sp.]|nr:glycosyltransferase [Crocinitomix sp.]
MKIVVLLSRFPYPLEKGDKLRAYHQLKELSRRHEIILCSLTDTPLQQAWIDEVESFCAELHVFKLKKPLIYWNTIKQLFTNKPYQTGYFFQRGIQQKIGRIIEAAKPDHIYCQLIRTTEYVKNIHDIPKTLDYMDALSKGMYRRAEITSGIKKKLFLLEGRRLAEYENRIFDYFNHHTIISEQDKKFINHPQKEQIAVIENGISSDFSTYDKAIEREFDIVFTGNMNYPPNVECAEYIVKEIYPILLKKRPNTRILLSGASPHQRVSDLAETDKIVVTGWVEDIRDSYAKGKLFLAPLFIGTGLQNKLLEAMAMGLPAITTPLANNALEAVHEETAIIANKAEEFAAAVIDLLEDEAKWKRISENGRTFVNNKFDWAKSVEKLERLMERK